MSGIIEIIKPARKQPLYTLFIPFTRDWLLTDFLEMLDNLAMPLGSMEFVFFNDTDNMSLQGRLREYLESKELLNNATLYMSKQQAPTETNVETRRQRVVDMKNRSRALVNSSHYTICIEDDTFVRDSTAVAKLIKYIDGQENVGFVSGVQRGRWGFSIIGAWAMDDVHNPTVVSTLPYKQHGTQYVDGAGMYFYITPTNLYKQATYHFDAECLGPDVCYVQDLRKGLYECFVDWDIVCEHWTSSAHLVPTPDCMTVTYRKLGDKWLITESKKNPVENSA